MFVPKHPKIKPVLSHVLQAESVLDIDSIIKKCLEEKETILIEGIDGK